MGTVLTSTGQVEIPELEGIYNLSQLFSDVKSESYTVLYRTQVINALGRLGKQAWGALSYLHDIARGNSALADVAFAAIKSIDPNNPDLKNISFPKNTGKSKGEKAAEGLVAPIPIGSAAPPTTATTTGSVTTTAKKQDKKPEKSKVIIKELELPPTDLGEGARAWGQCNFCGKVCMFHGDLKKCCERVVGPNHLYCHFCIRNDLYQRYAKNTLILTFRGVIGYYYYCFHACKQPAMWITDLHDYIELHIRLGVQNPIFRYDPESFLWFIDFSKVGTGRRKMPVEYILQTVVEILAGFNLYENVRECSPFKMYDKYREAIMDFYHHRKRPPEQKILAPTLVGTGIPHESTFNVDKAIPVHLLRNFSPAMMTENQYWHRRQNLHRY